MAQIFHPSSNAISRLIIYGVVFFLTALAGVLFALSRSPYVTEVGVPLSQPVPFSHKHHAADDGIDCRYCHTSVETTSFAGLPSTETCMSCHSQLWREAPVLAPVRGSLTTNKPLRWNRVNDLPDFAY